MRNELNALRRGEKELFSLSLSFFPFLLSLDILVCNLNGLLLLRMLQRP